MPWNEAIFVAESLLVLVALALPLRSRRVEGILRRIAYHRLSPLVVAVFAMALRAALLPVEPVPSPRSHDELSYLFQADTFLHGRLANPTHPLWEHFETFHIDQFPTYASMYPPLSGLVLALGQLFLGSPFAGVWLSVGLMCGLLCWALRGWFTPGWAFFAASLAAIRLGAFSYWGDSYWGGALAACGGALLFGALPRLLRSSRTRDAVLAALGVVILLNTRPYEGFVFSLAVAMIGLWWARRLRLRAILPAILAVLVCGGAWMAYYNWRVFGAPTKLPYTVNRQTYALAPVYIFQSPLPPKTYRYKEMQQFYAGWEMAVYENARTRAGYANLVFAKLYWIWSFFVCPVLTLPLLAFATTCRSSRSKILLFVGAMMAASTSVVAFFQPHYLAPATVVFYAMIIQGMRALQRKTPRVVRAVPVVCVAMIGVRIALAPSMLPDDYVSPTKTWAGTAHTYRRRAEVAQQVLREGGQHVVIVRYGPHHSYHDEYVYNSADIDSSPIVWARDMGAEKNAELQKYYPSRKIWCLYADTNLKLMPYSDPVAMSSLH